MKILTEATPLALWHQAVQAAQSNCRIMLKPDVESYLVFMLMRHVNKPEILRGLLAAKFLQGLRSPRHEQGVVLQRLGDQCLLISGLYPAWAEKRQVRVRYYIELGRVCYEVISRENNDIFSILSQQFILLMDVLQSFRPCNLEILPPAISQLWLLKK